MTPERWRVVDAILQAALARDAARRDAYVAHACGDDAALRREVASLLAAHDVAADFLERPAAAALGAATAPAPTADRLAQALAGRYAIGHEIGRGGMATVYLAHDLRHGRRVAVKVLHEELAAAVGAERFLAEIRVTASLQHPHVLPLFDSGSAGALLWYVMPFVEGETLRARLAREARLPVGEAVRLAREVADALDHAHRRGVVHRDVKPENVLLQGGHALVADFGIALALEHAGGERITRTGLALGTPHYMAPEQAAGERLLDARADVYALGAVLHEMLAGEPPFAGASRQAVLRRTLDEPPPALAPRRADVPASLDAAVRRALAKRPDERFPSAAAFAAALAAPAAPADALPRGRVVSARGALYAAVATLVVGLAGGGVLARWPLAGWPLAGRWAGDPSELARPAVDDVALAPAVAADVGDVPLLVLDRAGRPERGIDATRPWTPRFSPDGRRVAYGAFGAGRSTSDLWVTDLGAGTTRRLTDDDADANDPQWSPDGATLAYSADAPGGKDLEARPAGGGPARVLAARDRAQFASDWLRDGSALLVTEEAGNGTTTSSCSRRTGRPARPYAATAADETAARDLARGRWVAYTSDESGSAEVYLDAYPRPAARAALGGRRRAPGVARRRAGALLLARRRARRRGARAATGDEPPTVASRSVLFRAPYAGGPTPCTTCRPTAHAS
jgi:serine/threonine-protein kinase